MQENRDQQVIKNVFSIDVEDYFHGKAFRYIPKEDWPSIKGRVDKNINAILELLEICNVKATFFFLGWIAAQYPDLVRKVRLLGHEIASHGYWHDIGISSPRKFYEDIRKSKETLEDITGEAIYGHRLPCFDSSRSRDWFLDVVEEASYLYDSSLYPTYHSWNQWTTEKRRVHKVRPGLYEVPMSAVQIGSLNIPMAGGGYMRVLPAQYFLWGIYKLNSNSFPAVLYVHPYDIDMHSPRPKSSNFLLRVRRGIRINNPKKTLETIFKQFPFTRIIDVLPEQQI